jgi:hypothetical protein
MGRQTYTLAQWFKKIAKAIRSPDDLGDHGGYTVDDVCAKLGVTKQAVHKMIDTDKLEAVAIVSKSGSVHAVFVTAASLEYYLANRRPYGVTGTFTLTPPAVD